MGVGGFRNFPTPGKGFVGPPKLIGTLTHPKKCESLRVVAQPRREVHYVRLAMLARLVRLG